eukprot:Sdes_comp19250_c0_seq1m10216
MPSNETCEKATYVPCQVGDDISDVETPALIVDLDALEHNLAKLSELVKGRALIRPHAKAYKCVEIANLQQKYHDSVGVCCAKLWEAERLVADGFRDVFITNQIVGSKKIQRLLKLVQVPQNRISVCVDDARNLEELSHAFNSARCELDVVVEVNVGQNRCGVFPGEDVVPFVKAIHDLPALRFKGLQAYHGAIQFLRTTQERTKAVLLVQQKISSTLSALERANISVEYVTGGGTGTFLTDLQLGLYTEIQPGSYIFMDANYSKNFVDEDASETLNRNFFKQSLFVLSSVQSNHPSTPHLVVDAGMKAVSLDAGPPELYVSCTTLPSSPTCLTRFHQSSAEFPAEARWISDQIEYICGGDEHGILLPKHLKDVYRNGVPFKIDKDSPSREILSFLKSLSLGCKLLLIPSHCDPTVNMHDYFVGVRQGRVEAVWCISGRGPGF